MVYGLLFSAFSFLPLLVVAVLAFNEPPTRHGRMREGATPVLNALSLFLMVAPSLLAFTLLRGRKAESPSGHCGPPFSQA